MKFVGRMKDLITAHHISDFHECVIIMTHLWDLNQPINRFNQAVLFDLYKVKVELSMLINRSKLIP